MTIAFRGLYPSALRRTKVCTCVTTHSLGQGLELYFHYEKPHISLFLIILFLIIKILCNNLK